MKSVNQFIQIKNLCDQVNKEAAKTIGAVPYSNTEFYTTQIMELYNLPFEEAASHAKNLSLSEVRVQSGIRIE